MTIIDWKEAQAHADLISSLGGIREWSAPYILISNNPRDDGKTCVDFMDTIGRGLRTTFRYGDREDSSVWCKRVHPARMQGSATHWQVTCEYSPPKYLEAGDNLADDPLDWDWEIESSTQMVQQPVWMAWNMDPFPKPGVSVGVGFERAVNTLGPVVNSAGTIYDPPLMREVPETFLRVTANLPVYSGAALRNFAGHINESAVSWSNYICAKYHVVAESFSKHYVLCSAANASLDTANNVDFWKYTYEFRLRQPMSSINPQDGFLEHIIDRGTARSARAGDPDGRGSLISPSDIEDGMADTSPIRDIEGERIGEPVLLNGAGQPIQGDQQTGVPVWFRWRTHPYANFRELPLAIFQ